MFMRKSVCGRAFSVLGDIYPVPVVGIPSTMCNLPDCFPEGLVLCFFCNCDTALRISPEGASVVVRALGERPHWTSQQIRSGHTLQKPN